MAHEDEDTWTNVDHYLEGFFLDSDDPFDDLAFVAERNAKAGLPAIDVSPMQGKLLYLLARMRTASRALEIGTLGGYSAIWIARGLTEGGKLVSIENNPHHARTAEENIRQAGLEDRVTVRIGAGRDVLAALQQEQAGPFDLVFIDADKANNPHYVKAALALSRKGTIIITDNVVRKGRITDSSTEPDIVGTQRLFADLAGDRRVQSTVLQTVGRKGWDGLALTLVMA